MRTGTGYEHTPVPLLADVAHELEQIFAAKNAQAQSYGTKFGQLWSLVAKQIRGGKAVRPWLFLETYYALDRSRHLENETSGLPAQRTPTRPVQSDVARIAAAIEALHFAFLLHDDVIDADTMRRGKPNLIGELIQQHQDVANNNGAPNSLVTHYAQTGGILAGNLLLAAAHQIFARVQLPEQSRIRLLDVLDETVFETTAGEFNDVGLSAGVIACDLPTVVDMSARKTAVYTFELPLRAAVALSGGSLKLEQSLVSATTHLGLAYQLQDDLLSTFGDPTAHGKDPYSDLREGKQTAIIHFARQTTMWPQIAANFGNPDLDTESAVKMRDALIQCGAEAFVRSLVEEQMQLFRQKLHRADGEATIPADVRDVLSNVATNLQGRQS